MIYKNWQIEKADNGILWVYLDKANNKVNTLDSNIFDELEQILTTIEQEQQTIKGVIFASKKTTGFIAGADISQFLKFKTIEESKNFVRRGQIIFDRLASLPVPTVAMIVGFCLGGGLEFALACTYRVAQISDKKNIGLPETLLGIHPGWGGSVRLPALIGALKALELILSGRSVTTETAQKMGFIDAAVPERHLRRAAETFILNPPQVHRPSFFEKLTNTRPIRSIVDYYIKRFRLKGKVNPQHYPAPYAILENWLQNGVDHEKAQLGEANSLAKLVLDDTAKNLVRVFFLRERLRGLAKVVDFKPKRVHVIGAGIMGGDIAAWCALQGLQVTLEDTNPQAIASSLQRAHKGFQKKLKKPRLVQEAMDRLQPDIVGLGIKKADVVIEAIIENLQIKQSLLKRVEAQLSPDAILATNTSSIPLDELNTVLKHPESLVGIHFFNPVALMELVEIVQGKLTSQKVIDQALSFVKQIGRLPVPVTSTPGFLVNRILMPYLMEALTMLDEGVPAEVIDKAAKDFGMPMGPVELADAVGLDICLSVAENLKHHFGGIIPNKLKQMVQQGELGRKSGKGFYKYSKGQAVKNYPKNYQVPEDLTDRLILPLVNESMACLRDQVVADGDLLDAAMIFGTGFAPFRGGPMNYACIRGTDKIQARLQQLAERYGDRFKPVVLKENKEKVLYDRSVTE